MRENVIDHRRGCQDAALQAGGAQGMLLQELPARPAPVRAIAARGGAAPQAVWRPGAVLGTIGPPLAQVRAAGKGTGTLGFCRHWVHLFQKKALRKSARLSVYLSIVSITYYRVCIKMN